ncbi:MAG: hypothetical protein R3C17_14125 [Planctomycetaceae bacterium]
MSNAKPYLFGAVLGASAMYVALQYHVVHSHDGFQMVPRTPQHSIGLAYADVRNWSPSQWTDRPELARALMAHGSSDLISESVAGSLADSVIEENSTLDQLRSFLENSTQDGASNSGAGLLEIPATPLKALKPNSEPDDELTRIPFPQDAKKEVITDPFRVAQGPQTPASEPQSVPRPMGTSRFSAADVIDGLRDDAGTRMDIFTPTPQTVTPQANSPGATPAPTTANSLTIAQQAQAMEDRIFGSSSAKADSAATVKSKATEATTESMFEEVSTQLENRAQAALNRAREATLTEAKKTANDVAGSTGSYLRQQVEQAAPDAVKSIINNAAAGNGAPSTGSLLDQFDPFLE